MSPQNCDVSKLKKGDKFYRILYYEVVEKAPNKVITVSDIAGRSEISNRLVECSAFATNQYIKDEKVTRTEMSEKIATLGHAAFQVTFRKAKNANEMADTLDLGEFENANKTKRRRIMKDLLEGEERVMNCRLYRNESDNTSFEFGRFRVIDLDVYHTCGYDEKKAMRLVDSRTVSSLIVDNCKYHI